MEYFLSTSPWPGVILWIILYISDYYLTIYSARGLREIGHIQFEGSFELTPQFQKDVDALKSISKRHVFWLISSSLLILFIWWLTKRLVPLPWNFLLYQLYLGMFLLLEVAVHIRHVRNVSLIREYRRSGGIEGKISYRRWFTYRMSASELYTFSMLFLIFAVLAYSPFFLGGALACFATGFKHTRLANKAKRNPSQAVEVQT
jgi:hypothetical protein